MLGWIDPVPLLMSLINFSLQSLVLPLEQSRSVLKIIFMIRNTQYLLKVVLNLVPILLHVVVHRLCMDVLC